MTTPQIGTAAPDFMLLDQDGTGHTLSQYRGRWILVYFYPKDDTPGCTKEACAIRDAFPQFDASKAKVLGISPDSVKSHKKFQEKYQLPFTLLADEGHKVAEEYGVWGRKKFMGREYDGVYRASFLVDPEGRIAKVYEAVKPEEHASEVLADLASIGA